MEARRPAIFVKSKHRSTWIDRIRRDPRVSHSAFRLSYLLAQDADQSGTYSQSLIELAGRAGVQPKTLICGLEGLAGLGYLSFERGGYGLPWRINIRPTAFADRDIRRLRG